MAKITDTWKASMPKHQWELTGGMEENPGVWDNGNGGLIYVWECSHCGLRRKKGVDYTNSRPGNDWSYRYFSGDQRVAFRNCVAGSEE